MKVIVVVHGAITDAVPDVPGLQAFSILRPHPDDGATHPDGVGAVVMAWIDRDAGLAPTTWFAPPVDAYRVDERVHFGWTTPAPGRPDVDRDVANEEATDHTDGPWIRDWADGTVTPTIVQCSFVRRHPSLTRAGFAAHWNDVHAPLVPVHHPGVGRYVQNVVVAPLTPDAPEVDGVAQLYFRTVRDLRERFYDSEAGRQRVADDVARFIDRPKGWRLTAQETWVRSAQAAGRQ